MTLERAFYAFEFFAASRGSDRAWWLEEFVRRRTEASGCPPRYRRFGARLGRAPPTVRSSRIVAAGFDSQLARYQDQKEQP